MSTALFDYIQAVKPSFGDEKRAKVGVLITHYITLARVSGGKVKMDNVLTTSGKSFLRKVLGNIPMVLDLAFALKVDTSYTLESARSEMRNLVIFVRVALAVMEALHEDTLRRLDDSYRGHRPAGYKPKSKWFGLRIDDSVPPVLARDLPQAQLPRAVNAKPNRAPISTSGPVPMARKSSDESSRSSGSSGSKSSYKRPTLPSPFVPCSSPPYGFVPSPAPMAPSSQAAYYAQCAAMAAYYHTMQQGMTGQRRY